MKPHREFVKKQKQDPEFAEAYEKAKQAVAVALARLREETWIDAEIFGRAG